MSAQPARQGITPKPERSTAAARARPAAHELRVLDGPQRGALLSLVPGGHYTLGSDWNADIVLRPAGAADAEAAAEAATASISLQAAGLLLSAQAGSVSADGRALAPGESAFVPWMQVWQVGDSQLAAGPPGPWADPEAADAAHAAPAATAAAAAGPAKAPAAQRVLGWGRRLATTGAAVVAASLSMWAIATAIAPQAPRPEALAQRAQASLHAAGMTAVTVTAQAGVSDPVVEGYLDTHAQRSRAEQLLAAQGLRPRFAVWVNESLAQAVQDVYRVQGVSAQVQTAGPGRVLVTTALSDPTPLAALERAVRRDVQGLNQLDVRNTAPPTAPSPVPAMDDPGKRVSSIVAGAEPYVVTQDGTRYFIGALLPTGHRILAISDGRVELEREGQSVNLVF